MRLLRRQERWKHYRSSTCRSCSEFLRCATMCPLTCLGRTVVNRLEVLHGRMLLGFQRIWGERVQHWHLSDFMLFCLF